MIKEFLNDVYPRALWVASGDESEVKEKFAWFDGSEIDLGAGVMKGENPNCCMVDAKSKSDNVLGELVFLFPAFFGDGSETTLKKIAGEITHESIRVANRMFLQLGVDVSPTHDEHFAYLAEFVARGLWDAAFSTEAGKKILTFDAECAHQRR